MPLYPTLPAETIYGDIELNLIDLEPPGMFPGDQASYWGQFRKVLADYMQANSLDKYAKWYANLDPRVVDVDDIAEWEYMVGVPYAPTNRTLLQRQVFVQNRLVYGGFSRALICRIIENFVGAVLNTGPAASFDPSGIGFDASGIALYSGASGAPSTHYRVYFDYQNFTYYVRIDSAIGVDMNGLTRELQRITPAGWTLNISAVANVLQYTSMIRDRTPIGYYKLDGNANDSSQYANAGTLFNAPGSVTALIATAADGGAGSALSFNGTNQHAAIPDFVGTWPFTQMTSTKVSFEAWVKPNAIPAAGAYRMAMAKGSWWLGMTENSGSAFWGFWTGAGSAIFTPIAVILGNTYHVVGTYDGVISRLYVNGIQVASQTIGGGSIGGPLRIGTWDAAQYWFSGVIDEVAVYDRVLSDSEILAHYNTGMNTP